jgi:hypothetical protein
MENIALFLSEQLDQIGRKRFQSTDDFITFKQGTFNIRLNAFLYRNKNTVYYAYIYPTDEKLLIDVKVEPINVDKDNKVLNCARLVKIKEKLEHGDLKLIVGENIIGQLARLAVMGAKQNWVLIIIVAVAVGIGAGGLGYSIGISHVPTVINATVTNSVNTPFPTPHIGG